MATRSTLAKFRSPVLVNRLNIIAILFVYFKGPSVDRACISVPTKMVVSEHRTISMPDKNPIFLVKDWLDPQIKVAGIKTETFCIFSGNLVVLYLSARLLMTLI